MNLLLNYEMAYSYFVLFIFDTFFTSFSFASLCSFPIRGSKVVPMTTGGVANKMTIYFVGKLIRSSDFYGDEKNCDVNNTLP
jgi:hypothetical protein